MSRIPFSEPDPAGSNRAQTAKKLRDLATEVSRIHPQALTRANGEELDHGPTYPANFTKGLKHNDNGLLENEGDYHCFVEAINSPDPSLFDKSVPAVKSTSYHCKKKKVCGPDGKPGMRDVEWRGWESPRAGHVYELQGPDAGAVGMAPAPRLGSSELAAEMAEVYSLAILRDVPFTTICEGGDETLCGETKGKAKLSANEIVKLLSGMQFYKGQKVVSSTHVKEADPSGLDRFERNRRVARTGSLCGGLTTENVFRGSTKGAMAGPYISQFMLIGAPSLACGDTAGKSNFPGTAAAFGFADGFIPYGSLVIDQRTLSHKNCLDYMTDWCSWLDVQNGANFKGADQFEKKRRFITTPRDLATYVHFDALYEAYLNATLIMLALDVPRSKGFPEPSPLKIRDAFATFGGPHILSLVTEVATRCLKAVRRQKFNYHRRARPEAIGGRLTLMELISKGAIKGKALENLQKKMGCTTRALEDTLQAIPQELLDAIVKHNKSQNQPTKERSLVCDGDCDRYPKGVNASKFDTCNYLLPMAFPEGSPMHPAYGAGHATVAGGCVTMLKSFFEMYEDCDSFVERPLVDGSGQAISYVPTDDGSRLKKSGESKKEALTIQGELDKLAANISIGRNMAGVHYYSDYYDSLRMGERIAVGILLEQAPTYGETVQTTFTSFDGDHITLSGKSGAAPSLSIIDRDGNQVSSRDWWLRHVSGEELVLDL